MCSNKEEVEDKEEEEGEEEEEINWGIMWREGGMVQTGGWSIVPWIFFLFASFPQDLTGEASKRNRRRGPAFG